MKHNPAIFGREAELEKLEALSHESRFVSITGPGGVGKTTLLNSWLARTSTPALICDLAASGGDLGIAMLRALSDAGHRVSVEDPGELGAALDGSQAVVVLENAEPINDELRELTRHLLESTTTARFVATTRESFGLDQERLLRLDPLRTGPKSPAAELFVARAERVIDADWDEAGTRLVAQIVAQLDGLPLAIELAAGRLKVLSLAELATRVEHDLGLLKTTDTSIAERHRLLSAVVEASIDALPEDTQDFLASLSVFAASFDVATVEAVTVSSRAIDQLDRLLDGSLIYAIDGTPRRFRLLTHVRQVASDRLSKTARGEFELAHARHFVVQLAASAHRSATEIGRLRDLEPDLSAAHRRALARPEDEQWRLVTLQTALLLEELLSEVGPVGRVAQVLDNAHEAIHGIADNASPELRHAACHVLMRKARVQERIGWNGAMWELLDHASALAESGSATLRADVLYTRGVAHSAHSDQLRAREEFERALAASPERDLSQRAKILVRLAATEPDVPRRHQLLNSALEYARRADDQYFEMIARSNVVRAIILGDDSQRLPEARQHLARVRALNASYGSSAVASILDLDAGHLELAAGDGEAALQYFRASCTQYESMEHRLGAAIARLWVAVSSIMAGDLSHARDALGTAELELQGLGKDYYLPATAYVRRFINLIDVDADIDVDELADLRASQPSNTYASSFLKRATLTVFDPVLAAREVGGAVVRVAASGEWFEVEGAERVNIHHRESLVGILRALVSAYRASARLDVFDLVEAGWPGEVIDAESGTRRAYVAVATLRKLGLSDVLVNEDGYLLDSKIPIAIVNP